MLRPVWHILLIEDSAEDRADLRQMLLRGGSRGYRFSEAELGSQGVQMALDPASGRIDCVLLDYCLPDMDAPQVLAALCDGAHAAPCPVVVITGSEVEERGGLLSAGAQDYIGKRWTSPESLTRAIENAVERFAWHAERLRSQDALRDSEQRYRALFNSIDAGLAVVEMVFDESGAAVDARYLQVNPAFARHSGLRNVEGRTLRDLVPTVEPDWITQYGAVAITGEPLRMERYVDGLQRWFDLYAFRLGEPSARQVAVLFRDTTARKETEVALLAAKAEADKANRAKSDFLLAMSHELRSPLSAMLGFTQLIEAGKPPPTPAQQDSVRQILQAGWYLLGLINEILDLTSVESGQLSMSMQTLSINEVLQDCQAMVQPQAQERQLQITFEPLASPLLVQADPIRTKQVLINLLNNAIKYNRSAGHIEVRCTELPDQRVRVSVQDTGPGLSATQLAQLFEPFNRLGQVSGGVPGTGIGLVICKRLVELMGGRIGAQSSLGVGSNFWFELDAAPAPQQPTNILPVHTVLCIEHHADRMRRVETVVADWPGACLLRAGDLPKGIQIARTARPDLILMGIQAPGSNSRRAMRRLAMDPATASIPVIALHEGAAPNQAQAGQAAGFFSYLTQPMHSVAFASALEDAFQQSRAFGQRTNAKG